MRGTLLIVAPADDLHALAVKRRIQQIRGPEVDVVLLDPRTFPTASTISWRSDDAGRLTAELSVSPPLPGDLGTRADPSRTRGARAGFGLDQIISIWMRRPEKVGIDARITIPEFRDAASLAMRGALGPLFSIRPTHNPPATEARLRWKPLQLYLASRSGLRTPRTLVTSAPREALDFVANLAREGKETVYKQVVSTPDGPPTRLFTAEDSRRANDMALTPTLFQERIAGGPDLRVLVVQDKVFATEWRREREPAPVVDIRLDPVASVWPTKLDEDLTARLIRLHDSLGLSMGVYDFKVDSAGVPHFLEVNPTGQWLNLEIEAGHPVSWSVAQMLLGTLGADDARAPAPFSASDLRDLVDENEEQLRGTPSTARGAFSSEGRTRGL